MSQHEENVTRLELESRVLYSLLLPAVRLARRCHVSLDRVTEMVTLAYVGDLRSTGLTLKESATALGKSIRTVTGITRRLREDFFAPEREHGLPRRVEYLLFSQPLTADELLKALNQGPVVGHQVVSSEALHGALQILVDEGRARQEARAGGEAVYEVTQRYANLVRAGLSRRVDALNHLGEALADTVMSRFFDENEVAFARTLTFSAPVAGVMALRKKVYDTVRLAASDLEDEAAETGSSGEKYSLVFAITPTQGGSL